MGSRLSLRLVLWVEALVLGFLAAGCRTDGQVRPAQSRSSGLGRKPAAAADAQIEQALGLYVDESPAPVPTPSERSQGFILFSRPLTRVLFPADVPGSEERVSRLRIAACPDEYEPVILALWALRDLTNVRLSVSTPRSANGSLPATTIDVRAVRVHPKLGQRRWGPFHETLMEVPLFLERRDAVTISANRNQAFWLTAHIPPDALPGEYAATVTVSTAESQGAQLPLIVRVYDFKLEEPRGIRFAMCDRLRTDTAWLAEAFADLRAHGMTGLVLTGPESGLKMGAGGRKVTIDWDGTSALERTMDAYAKAGFPEPVTWIWHTDIVEFCKTFGPLQSEEFAEAYRQVISGIEQHGRERGWSRINYCPVDEPFDDPQQFELALRLLQILNSMPEVNTEANGINAPRSVFNDEAYSLLDVMALHDGPVLERGVVDMGRWWAFRGRSARDGKRIEFYNIDLTTWHTEPLRFMTGFGLWKSGAQGIYEWAYMWAVKESDPAWIYSQPRPVVFRYPAAGDEVGGPTTGYEAIREGVDDYRYLLTLHRLVERAKQQGRSALADQVWRPVQAKLDAATFEACRGKAAQGEWTGKCEIRTDGTRVVRGDLKIKNNWTFGDYDALREKVARGIQRLKEALQG